MKTSVMLESYCADIERLVRDSALRAAVRFAVALPDIGAALESTEMRSSPEQYTKWCAAWLTWKVTSGGKPIDGARLYRLYDGPARISPLSGPPDDLTSAALRRLRMSRRARRERSTARQRMWQPVNRIQAFELSLVEALVDSSRRWYREQGANNSTVQLNLGRLLVSG
jgi:hypothetical protein